MVCGGIELTPWNVYWLSVKWTNPVFRLKNSLAVQATNGEDRLLSRNKQNEMGNDELIHLDKQKVRELSTSRSEKQDEGLVGGKAYRKGQELAVQVL